MLLKELKRMNEFRNGNMSMEDIQRLDQPSMYRSEENVEKICTLVYKNRRCTIDELAEVSGLSWSSVQ